MKSRVAKIVNIFFLLLGAALLTGLLVKLDFDEVKRHLIQVGWYFALAFFIFIVGLMLNAYGWKKIVDPRSSRARYRDFLAAFWVGYAINQVTPGASLGEVLKGTILKGRIDSDSLIASLISFNFLSTFVSQIFTLFGAALCLVALDLPTDVILVLFGLALIMFIPIGLLYLLLRWGIASRVVSLLAKIPFVKVRDPDALLAKARSVDKGIRELRSRRPGDFWIFIFSLIGVKLTQVLELFVLLIALIPGQGVAFLLLLSLLAQTATQLLCWAATFVPGQIGVAEGFSALLFKLLGLDPIRGFAMELVRRIRRLLCIGIGLAIGFWPRGGAPSETDE